MTATPAMAVGTDLWEDTAGPFDYEEDTNDRDTTALTLLTATHTEAGTLITGTLTNQFSDIDIGASVTISGNGASAVVPTSSVGGFSATLPAASGGVYSVVFNGLEDYAPSSGTIALANKPLYKAPSPSPSPSVSPNLTIKSKAHKRTVAITVRTTKGARGVISVKLYKGKKVRTAKKRSSTMYRVVVPSKGRWKIVTTFTGRDGYGSARVVRHVRVR